MPAMHQLKSLILAGHSNSQIAAAMHLTYTAVAQRFFKLCKVEGVKGRKGLFQKYATIAKLQPAAHCLAAPPAAIREWHGRLARDFSANGDGLNTCR